MTSQRPLEDWYEAERSGTVEETVQTITNILEEYAPLVDLVAACMPSDPDPKKDIVLISRTGALFPVYRTFSLLEQLKGRVHVPTVLFYPGDLDGASGLRFMSELDAEHKVLTPVLHRPVEPVAQSGHSCLGRVRHFTMALAHVSFVARSQPRAKRI
jgi:hypothetical protein